MAQPIAKLSEKDTLNAQGSGKYQEAKMKRMLKL